MAPGQPAARARAGYAHAGHSCGVAWVRGGGRWFEGVPEGRLALPHCIALTEQLSRGRQARRKGYKEGQTVGRREREVVGLQRSPQHTIRIQVYACQVLVSSPVSNPVFQSNPVPPIHPRSLGRGNISPFPLKGITRNFHSGQAGAGRRSRGRPFPCGMGARCGARPERERCLLSTAQIHPVRPVERQEQVVSRESWV